MLLSLLLLKLCKGIASCHLSGLSQQTVEAQKKVVNHQDNSQSHQAHVTMLQ